MRSFELALQFPSGSVMIGGHADIPEGLHAHHALDARGNPVVPATSIRGALRESLEAVLRGANLPACAGGTGLLPEQAREGGARPVPCALDGGATCVACRLFGTQRAAIAQGERRFSGLILGAAESASCDFAWSIQPGVSVARNARSAEDNRLFLRRVPAPSRLLRFVAKGRLLDDDLRRYFDVAVRSTTHLGSGRSRGTARVEMSVQWSEDAEPGPAALPPQGDLRLNVTLLSPASIGVPTASDGVRDTRLEIPGAALRGAVGFALAEALQEPTDEAFQALVAETGAHFGFLYPVVEVAGRPNAPLPITAAECKYGRSAHGTVDTLLDRIAAEHVETASQALLAATTSLTRCGLAACGGPLRGADRKPVPTRTVTRLAMDRAASSARDKHLFTQILLKEGARFEGSIRNIPPGSRERLAEALAQPLSLGRGRSSGWGRVNIEVSEASPQVSIVDRGRAFDEALRRRLELAALPCHRVGRLVPVTLLSPLIASDGEDDGSAELARALDAACCFLKARRFSREGGWDQRTGKMEPALAAAAGGIFVFELREGCTWSDALATLQQIERVGVGQRRHQGYGQVLCFDPFIRVRAITR